MKLCLIGGHATPALAVMQYGVSHHSQFIYIAVKPHSPHQTREIQLANQFAQVFTLETSKFDRNNRLQSLLKLPRLLRAVYDASKILHSTQPDLVVSFGGFISVPVILAAALKRIPVVIHEQTTLAGLANRSLARFAKKVVVSYSSSAPFFPATKTIVMGNLIRQEFFTGGNKPRWLPTSGKPILLILGASQGSVAVNKVMSAALKLLRENWLVVHQTGAGKQLTPPSKDYYPVSWLDINSLAWLMHHATVIVSRSGANTVSEIEVSHTPAILIPLPNTQMNEQYHNARYLQDQGQAIIIPQNHFSTSTLLQAITQAQALTPKSKKVANHLSAFYQILASITPSYS